MTLGSGSEIPFIDRQATLEELRKFLRLPGGRCLAVIGRRGIGKSRLLRHFAELIAAEDAERARIVILHEVRSSASSLDEYTQLEASIAHHPEVRKLVHRPGLADWVPELVGWLRRILIAAEPTGGNILSHLPLDKLVRRAAIKHRSLTDLDIVEQILKTLQYLSRLLTEDQRLVLVLDPSADYDELSKELGKFLILQDIVRNLPDRVHILLALRDSDPVNEALDFFNLPNVGVLHDLGPFQSADVHDLLKRVFGPDVPFKTALKLHQKYEGDPLSTGMAIDLALRQGDRPLRTLIERCPEKLQELMQRYHDSLRNPLHRRILRILGVMEAPVPVQLIVYLLEGEADAELVYLALNSPELKFSVSVVTPSSGDRCYRVYHATFAEYLQVLAREFGEMRPLHRRAGHFFQQSEDPARALNHFAYARDLDGIQSSLEAGLEWHRSRGETRRLGELYEMLHPLALSKRDQFLLGKAYAWSRSMAGETEEVIGLVENLLPAAGEDTETQAELLLLRGDCYHNSSRYQESYRDFQAAQALLEEIGLTDTLLYRRIRLEAAHMETHLGDFRASVRNHDALEQNQVKGEAEDRQLHLLQWAREQRRYGEVLVFTGEWDFAESLLDSARNTFQDFGNRSGQGNAYRRLADLCLLRGGEQLYKQALSYTRQAYELLRGAGSRGAGWIDFVRAEAYRGLGRLSEALKVHRSSLQRYEGGRSPHLLSMAELGVAESERMLLPGFSLDRYDAALERYKSIGFEWGVATALTYRGLARLCAGLENSGRNDLDKAERIFERLALAPALGTIRRIRDEKSLGFYPIIVL